MVEKVTNNDNVDEEGKGKKSKKESRTVDEDYIFEHIVGGSGKWQWMTTFITFPLLWIGGYPLFISIYAAYTPQHRCLIQQCDGPDAGVMEPYVALAVPSEHHTENILRQDMQN